MASNTLKQKNVTPNPHYRRNRIIFAVVLIVLLLAYDLSGIGGNIRFYSKWIECGQKPVVANMTADFSANMYSDYGYPHTVSLMRGLPTYYCTPLEAEKAGSSASQYRYETPYLDAQKRAQ